MPRVHRLKTWPEYFKSVVSGRKTFEIRKNDRDFKVGDHLELQEYYPVGGFSGRVIIKTVSYVLDDPTFLKEGYVALGLRD